VTAGPVSGAPSPDLLRLVARQLFEEINAEHRRGLGYASLRQVEVTTVDAANRNATVILGGDVDNPVAGVKSIGSYVPQAGHVAWAWQSGSDLLLAGAVNQDAVPKARLFSTRVQSQAPGSAVFDFSAAGGAVSLDANFGGGLTMADLAASRIYCRWPGKYRYGAAVEAAPDNASSTTVMATIRLNGATIIARSALTQASANAAALSVTDLRAFTAGNFIELLVDNLGQNTNFGSGTQERGAKLWMSYDP